MLFGPLLRWDYMFIAPALKMKMLQNAVVLFDSLTGKNIRARCCSCLVDFDVLFIHSCIWFIIYFMSFPFHTWTVGGLGGWGSMPRASQPLPTPSPLAWVLGQALGGAARCIFPWSKPWLCMGTELGGLQSRKHMVESFHQWMIFEWMPASSSTGSFESLCLFSRFLVIVCLFVCLFWGRGAEAVLLFFLRMGI